MVTSTASMATNIEVTSVDQSDESAITALYRAAIGPISRNYYLTAFSRFEDAGKAGLSWNWAAGLVTLNWLVFRQLWGVAIAYAGVLMIVILAVFGIGRMLFQMPQEAEIGLIVVVVMLSVVLPGFFGNALFHAHSRKRMANALRTTATLPEACAVLTNSASSRQHLIGILIVNLAFAGAIGGAVVALRGAGASPANTRHVAEVRGAIANSVTHPIREPMSPASAPLAPAVTLAPSPELASAAVAAGRYQINVGLFANDANAQRVHAQLQAVKLDVYSELLETTHGKRTRVRVGPFKIESDANAAAHKIRSLQFDAVVFEQ